MRVPALTVCLAWLLMITGVAQVSEDAKSLIGRGSEWAYWEDGSSAPSTWKGKDFDDAAWKHGPAPLGYGDVHFKTTLSYGEDAASKPITALFRQEFQVSQGHQISALLLEMMHDDGIMVYLNGKQLTRAHMPTGFVDMETPALHRSSSVEASYQSVVVRGDALEDGVNVIAVAVHQTSPKSSDLGFDLALSALHGDAGKAALEPGGTELRTGKIVRIVDLQAVEAASRADWATTSVALGERALSDYASGKVALAGKRIFQGKAAALFAQTGSLVAPRLKKFLLDQTSSAQEFFEALSERDRPEMVFRTLNEFYEADPARLKKYLHLGMAIALVYDQRPPSQWPHRQVSPRALPRRLPKPMDAFDFWTESNEAGKTLHDLDTLALSELVYVVDTPAPFEELRWAQDTLKSKVKLSTLSNLYSGIRYDYARYVEERFNWEGSTYSLAEILEQGGICVDQAYFTITVAKALGVPAMQVSGEGRDGRHAWVGFLEKPGQWNFDTGRYPESKFVTGFTYNPQTWERLTDHALVFGHEGFQTTSAARSARVHGLFADSFAKLGKHSAAIDAAKAAITLEKRTVGAWDTLIVASQANDAAPEVIENYCRKAAETFRRYPDMEASFMRRLIHHLKSQGNDTEAGEVRKQIILRHRKARPDLALAAAAEDMAYAMKHESIKEQSLLYKSLVSRFRSAGMITGYRIVRPYVYHLLRRGLKDEAKAMIKYARSRLDVGQEEQLERLLQGLEAAIR